MPLQRIVLPSPEREKWVTKHVPYRIRILRGLAIYNAQGGKNGALQPVFPSIFEASLIICRWTANFLGLCLDEKRSLQQATRRKHATDIFVIDVGGALVDPAALSDAERMLLTSVLDGANVASAHPTREGRGSMDWRDVEPASALLIEKLKTNLYDVLGMDFPK